jgi:hypothetical protein
MTFFAHKKKPAISGGLFHIKSKDYSSITAAATAGAALARDFFSFSGAGMTSSTPANTRPQCSQTKIFFLSLISV